MQALWATRPALMAAMGRAGHEKYPWTTDAEMLTPVVVRAPDCFKSLRRHPTAMQTTGCTRVPVSLESRIWVTGTRGQQQQIINYCSRNPAAATCAV